MKGSSPTSSAQQMRDRLFSGWLSAIRTTIRLLQSEPVSTVFAFVIGFFLARAVFWGSYAPLGVSFTAASHRRHPFAAATGALIGYILAPSSVDGLKYAAAVLLCLAAALIFRDTEAMEYRMFMPVSAAIGIACVGFVSIFETNNTASLFALFLCEIGLTVAAAWFYSEAVALPLTSVKQKETGNPFFPVSIGHIVLAFSLLCVFSDFTIAGIISPVRAAALIFVLFVGRQQGAPWGAAVGLLVDTLMDMRAGHAPFFAMTYGIAAFTGGLSAKKGKFFYIIVFLLTHAAASVWGLNRQAGLSGLYEGFIASVLFFLLPDRFSSYRGAQRTESIARYISSARQQAARQIREISSAFSGIYQTLYTRIHPAGRKNDENLSIVFDAAADKVCRGCAIRNICWERDYITTFGALNDTTAAIAKNGRADKCDFPVYFSSRCLHFTAFVASVNEAASAMTARRQQLARMRETGESIREQYAGMAGLLNRLSAEIEAAPEFYPSDERRISAAIRQWDDRCEVSVFRTPRGRMIAELHGKGVSPLLSEHDRLAPVVSSALGCAMSPPEQAITSHGWALIFKETERLSATVGVAARKKRGADASGDNGTYFKTDEGLVYLILSDGMGAGREAAAASAGSIALIEPMLRAGISPSEALSAVWPALKLKADEQGFATLDIVSIDLFSGECSLLKCGAAESFFRCGRHLSAIRGGSMPPGVGRKTNAPPDPITARVDPEDWIVMVSDGITGAKGAGEVRSVITNYEGDSPKELARLVLDAALAQSSAEDDMTVFALRIAAKNSSSSCET